MEARTELKGKREDNKQEENSTRGKSERSVAMELFIHESIRPRVQNTVLVGVQCHINTMGRFKSTRQDENT